jgi:hypothetical protein
MCVTVGLCTDSPRAMYCMSLLPAVLYGTAARPGAGRHSLWIAVCEASGLAAVVLASPLAPMVLLFRATPRGGGCRTVAGEGNDGGGGGGGVGHLLAKQTFGGAPCNGLLLFRNQMLTMQVLCSDVMGVSARGHWRFRRDQSTAVPVHLGLTAAERAKQLERALLYRT